MFGKGIATEMAPDWKAIRTLAQACNGSGGWLPREDKASNQVPSYAWFNGTSEVYSLSKPSRPSRRWSWRTRRRMRSACRGSRAYILGVLLGSVSDVGAKLHPMKEHLGSWPATPPPTRSSVIPPATSSAPATSMPRFAAGWSRPRNERPTTTKWSRSSTEPEHQPRRRGGRQCPAVRSLSQQPLRRGAGAHEPEGRVRP